MARIFTESFESVPVGGAVSTANTTFDFVTAGMTAVSSPVAVGSRAAHIQLGATAANRNLQVSPTTLGTRSILFSAFYFQLAALPGADWYPLSALSNGTARADVRVNTDGTVSLRNGFTAVWTSTEVVPTGSMVRFEWKLDATAAVQQLWAYDGHSTTQLFTSGSRAFNTGTFTTFSAGAPVATTNLDVVVDWVALDDTAKIGPGVVNQRPQVSAGADQTGVAAAATVTLTGTATDPDGTIASQSWTQTGGTAVTLSGSGATRTFTAPSSGSPQTLTFEFSATDNLGFTTTDSMTVGVLATGSPATGSPIVSAGADQSVEPWSTVTLTGTASDPGGSIASRAWTQTAGTPTVTLSGATTATATFQAPGTLDGTSLTFQFSATDNSALTTTDTVAVAVYPAAVRAVIDGALVPVQIKTATKVVVPRTAESTWAGPVTATTDTKTTSAWAGPVTATTDATGAILVPELPFAMPSRSTMRAANKPVIAYLHTLPPYWREGSTIYTDRILPSMDPTIGGQWRQRPHPLNSNVNLTNAKRIQYWTDDITAMTNIGIDGVSCNMLGTSFGNEAWRWTEHILPLYDAADAFNAANAVDFSVALNLSMLNFTLNNISPTAAADKIYPVLSRPCAQKMADGRPMVYLYNIGQQPETWYTSFANRLQTTYGINVAMIPSWQSNSPTGLDNYATLWNNNRFAMLHVWGVPAYTVAPSSISSSIRSWATSNGVPFCGSVGPAWENDRPASMKEKEGKGLQILQNMWDNVILNDDPMVQIVSWNDHEESHNIKPSTGYQYVPYDVTAYYLAKYKTGSFPTITRDAIMYAHRMHLSTAPFDQTRQTAGAFNLSGALDQVLTYTFLKSGGTDVTVTIGGTAHLHSGVAAGLSLLTDAMAANSTFKFKAVRSGTTVVPEFSSAFPTRSSLVYQDLLYRMGGSNRPPIPGVQSDLPQDR